MKLGDTGAKVTELQQFLNDVGGLSSPLPVTGSYDSGTAAAVTDFQTHHKLKPTGKADAHTLLALADEVAVKNGTQAVLFHVPVWLKHFMTGAGPVAGSKLQIAPQTFFEQYLHTFGHLTPTGGAALGKLLTFIEDDPDINDVRWAAYMLSTVRIECGPEYTPIPEHGCHDNHTPVCSPIPDNSRSYGNHIPCPNRALKPPIPCPAGKKSHTYYGRGYVQLTHRDNYETMGAQFGVDLIHFPERALDPTLAYQIMSFGMRNGSFTTAKLSQFTKLKKFDYFNARTIVNGHNKAREIESNGKKFEAILRASLI